MEPVFETRRTAIFAKRPRPGQVKTRLCPPLTPRQAARLADAMLRDTVRRCAGARGFRTLLCHAPADEGDWFRREFPGLELRPQQGPDLGQRLAALFEQVLASGEARTLVAIGSDQPLVGSARIREAHRALEDGADCVLGPDQGGGYYLVGLKASLPELFSAVPMSSVDTLTATLAVARARGLGVRLLAPEQDVDHGADLPRLARELEARAAAGGEPEPDFPHATRRCLRELADLWTSVEGRPGGR